MKRCTEMEGSEERSGGNQVTFNSTSEALRHARVEFDDKRIPVIDISMQSYVILDTVKICSKTDIEKIEKKTYCTHLVLVKMIELGYLKVVIEWQSK